MPIPGGRPAILAAVALLAAGFGGGFLTARMMAPKTAATAPQVAPASSGFDWPLFGKLRAADAPRAAVRKPDGFAVWTTRLDTTGGSPRACIRMSEPLDPARSYGDFVSVSPGLGHPAAVTVSGDELCVAGVGYDGRTITLLSGLPAKGGDVLQANADVAFQAGAKPVYVGFAGAGVILPREDADGVGLETVNVSRLHLEVWRVADRNLVRKEISAPEPTPEGGYDYEYGENGAGQDGRRIWEGDMAVRGQPDQKATTVFPLGAVLKTLEPGAYLVTASDASGLKGDQKKKGLAQGESPARARRWILFTDMALQAYDGSDALDLTVRSLKTAKAMGGVRVALVGKDGGELASVTSDGSGRAHFARALLAGESGAAPARVMAYGPRGDFTVMDLERAPIDLSKQDVSGRQLPGGGPRTGKAAVDPASAVDGFLYADRGIYRPGETVHLVALLRDRLARSVKDRRGFLVLRRPSGLEFSRYHFAASPSGAVNQDAVLPAAAPRGVWHASLEMEGSDATSGEVSFQVEDFVPQRLAVTVAADADRPVLAGETRQVQVTARFLYGAVASALPVRSEGRVIADPNPFPALKDYRWGDQKTPFPEKLLQGSASVTDGQGKATQAFKTDDLGGSDQPLLALFTASVFEPGGRPVSEQANLKVRLKSLYLGVKTTSGSGEDPLQTFEVIAVDASGRRVAAPKVHYRLIAERWNYDWYEQNGRWAWRRTSRDVPIAEGMIAVGPQAAQRISRKLGWGDYRLELDDAATGARTVVRQASGWGEPADGVEPPDSARVAAVRTGYRTGDQVEVRIEAPFAGEAEVAVASDRLIASKSVTVPKEGTTVKLTADAAWGAGAYVMVTVVQPRDPVSSPKPRRALGVAYVPLEPPGRKLQVAMDTPQVLDSKAPVVVPLTVKGLGSGEKAHVTLAAVDEGVLRLTHQKNPDPIAWYFGKRALALSYRDDYGRLLDPNLGAAGAVNFGGDEFGGAGLTVVPTKTVALWSGVVDTDANGKATIRLPAGDFNGQLRLVAVAWTDKAVGAGAADMTVRQPVVAELSLPRFLAPGDHAQATLELNNVAGRPGPYTAQVGGVGYSATQPKPATLASGQRVSQHLDIAASNRPLVGAVTLKASGPGFADERRYPLQTRLGWGPSTRATSALQQPGESYTPPASVLSGYAAGGVSLTVSYSPFRGFDPAPIAAALSRYPYGCSEQLVSTAFPLLYAPEVGGTPRLRAASASLAPTVAKLLDREALDGSFGLWRVGDGEADPWLGAYIVDFLLEAKAKGAPVPEDSLVRALNGMRLVSKPDGFSSIGYRMNESFFPGADMKLRREENQRRRSRAAAYALYDLAKAGQGDLARLRWFHDVGFKTEPSALARAQVGAGLAAMGDRVRAHDSFVQVLPALGYVDRSDWYQSPLRDLAGVIALAYEAGETGIARELQDRLENTVKSPDDLNTQEQGHLLKAASAMMAAAGPLSIQAAGVQPQGASRYAVGRLADARLVNTGKGAIWRTVTVSGLPATPPPAQTAGLHLDKRYYALDGSPVDPAALKQGERVIVRLSVQADDAREMQTVVDDPLPAGLEIEAVLRPADAQGVVQREGEEGEEGEGAGGAVTRKNAAPGRFAFLGSIAEPSLQEKRDDRYVAAFTLASGKPVTLAYVARAVTAGDFFLPGAEARNMYRPAVNARTPSSRLKVAAAP
ncbi:MAG: alpha-2-macroglobulin family protein [Caulobacteraceae bacterium]